MEFTEKIDTFRRAYQDFLHIYDFGWNAEGGFDYTPQSIADIVAELPITDAETRKENLFLWITKAACNLLPQSDHYDLSWGGEFGELMVSLLLLLEQKNANYGNSALAPNLFYADSLSAADCILVRLSDKVKRIDSLLRGEKDKVGESLDDTTRDFIGYSVLLYIALYIDDEPLLFDAEPELPSKPILLMPSHYATRPFGEIYNEIIVKGDFYVAFNEQDHA